MLLFLDIDGVMVPAKGWKLPEFLDDGFPDFSIKASRTLQNLISDDTTVLLTTSHKSNYTIEEWKSIFKRRGINIAKLKSLNNNVNNLSRKDEILNWFDLNVANEAFIIIDDDKSLNSFPDFFKRHLILTSPFIGLVDEHLEMAKAILNDDLQSV